MPLWNPDHPGIFVEGDQTFFTACCKDLNKINEKEIGGRLLSTLSKRTQGIGTSVGKRVTINYTNNIGDVAQDSVLGNQEVRNAKQPGRIFHLPAVGDSSVISYGHDLDQVYTTAIGLTTPPFIALAHELIHALHVISGEVAKEYDWSTDGAIIEEARTVGIGPYVLNTSALIKPLTENAIRWEWGLPQRTHYASPGDADGLPKIT
jgi:NleD-like pathogen effector protein (putative zinc metallopeptidase)